MRTAPGVLVQTALMLRGQPLIHASQMDGAMATFGETNGFICLFVQRVHANDAGVVAFEGDYDGFAR